MSVTASSTTAVSASPASEDALWALAYLLRAQWSEGLSVETAWQTDVQAGRSMAEQRRGLYARPARLLRLPMVSFRRDEALSLQMLLARATMARHLVPLFVDAASLDSAVSAGATSLPCTTDYRRFFAGARVVVYEPARKATLETFETATIGSVASGSITLTSGLASAYSKGARVVPLIEAVATLSSDGRFDTDRHVVATLEALEDIGPSMLPGLATLGSNPSGYDTHDSLPILDPPIRYDGAPRLGYERQGEQSQSGIAQIIEAYGDRPRARFRLPLRFMSRSRAWDLLRFFDSRGGRLYPWWLMPPTADYELTGVAELIGGAVPGVDVRASGPEHDWDFRPYIAIKLRNGTRYIRGVQSVSRSGDTDSVTFDQTIPQAFEVADVQRCGIARKMRFDSDALLEQWTHSELMDAEVQAVELLEEKSVTIADLSLISTTALPSAFAVGRCDASIYRLTDCSSGTQIYTTPQDADLSAIADSAYDSLGDYVDGSGNSNGKVLELSDNTCHTIDVVTSGTVQSITGIAGYASCSTCTNVYRLVDCEGTQPDKFTRSDLSLYVNKVIETNEYPGVYWQVSQVSYTGQTTESVTVAAEFADCDEALNPVSCDEDCDCEDSASSVNLNVPSDVVTTSGEKLPSGDYTLTKQNDCKTSGTSTTLYLAEVDRTGIDGSYWFLIVDHEEVSPSERHFLVELLENSCCGETAQYTCCPLQSTYGLGFSSVDSEPATVTVS